MTEHLPSKDQLSHPEVDYTLVVHKVDDTGRICIVSPEIPGLLLWARPREAFADVLATIKKLRDLNGMSDAPRPLQPPTASKDLVSRIREAKDWISIIEDGTVDQAADEIERLTVRVASLTGQVEGYKQAIADQARRGVSFVANEWRDALMGRPSQPPGDEP
jgi:hypothetical protein